MTLELFLTKPSRQSPPSLADDGLALAAAPEPAPTEVAVTSPIASARPSVDRAAVDSLPAGHATLTAPSTPPSTPLAERPGDTVAVRRPALDSVARIALPLACGIAWLVIAAFQREPSVAAEARFLGVVTTAVLLAALAAAPRVGTSIGAAVVLLGAIPWALPGTADRGAAVGILLAGILALVAGAATHRAAGSTATAPWTSFAWSPSRVVALVLGAQVLASSGDLLAPTSSEVLAVVAWALVAAAALSILAARAGWPQAAIAAATAFVLGPGFDATSALALAAPALAVLIADRRLAIAARLACAAILAAPLLWSFELGAFLLLGAIALAGPRWSRWTAGLAALTAFFAPGADRWSGIEGPAWLLLLVPIAVVELRHQPATRFAAISIALAVAAQIPDRSALAIPAALLAVTVGGKRPLAAALQSAWTGIAAASVAILAAYPWLRADALADASALLGVGEGWRGALSTIVLFGLAAAICLPFGRAPGADEQRWTTMRGSTPPPGLAPAVLAVLLAALALVAHPAIEANPLARQPIDLGELSPAWSARLSTPVRATSVVLDSSLSHAAAIAAGTPIAEVRLATASGITTLPVRAGVDTGEWAARRPDVAAIGGFVAPAAYLSWVDQSGRFFGQRYRARLRWSDPKTVTAVEVRLVPGLAPDVSLTLFHLELQR